MVLLTQRKHKNHGSLARSSPPSMLHKKKSPKITDTHKKRPDFFAAVAQLSRFLICTALVVLPPHDARVPHGAVAAHLRPGLARRASGRRLCRAAPWRAPRPAAARVSRLRRSDTTQQARTGGEASTWRRPAPLLPPPGGARRRTEARATVPWRTAPARRPRFYPLSQSMSQRLHAMET